MFDPATTEAFNECHPIYARWCGDGVVSNGETCDDGAQNGQPGKCNNTCSSTSSGTPMCSTAYSGTLTAPITQGYCNSGTVMNFTGTIVGNITNYTWQCA
jgi:hypothetical protein